MKFLKNILPAMATAISYYMFLSMNSNRIGWGYNDKFIDDFFTLLVFSGIIFIGAWFENEFRISYKWKYKLITALCAFWMFISSIYHWLTENEWNSTFIVLSLINIVAFGLYFIVYAREFYRPLKIFKSTLYMIAAFALFISAVTMIIFKYYYPAIVCGICILLVISRIIQNQLKKEMYSNEN